MDVPKPEEKVDVTKDKQKASKKPDSMLKTFALLHLLLLFVALVLAGLLGPYKFLPANGPYFEYVFFPAIGVLAILGLTLLIFIRKAGIKGILKITVMLTGLAVFIFPFAALLHNVFYGMFKDFFDNKMGGDEPFFFLLAIVVCPIAFLVGLLGTLVMVMMGKHRKFM